MRILFQRCTPRDIFFSLGVTLLIMNAASSTVCAQHVERTAGFQTRTTAIVKARVVISPKEELDPGSVLLRDGLIVAVGRDLPIPADADIIDGTGLVVYPGFVDAATSALLDPARAPVPAAGRQFDFSRYALAAMSPDNRKGLTPEFEARTALLSDASHIEARRRLGFTAVHVVPTGRIASGEGVLLSTSGAPLRESVLHAPGFTEFQLLSLHSAGYPATLMGAVAHLRQAFLDARRHAEQKRLYAQQAAGVSRPAEDTVLDALGEIIEKKRSMLLLANTCDDIHRAMDFSQEQQVAALIWGGKEAYLCAGRVKQQAAGVLATVDWGDEPAVDSQPGNPLAVPPKDPLRVQQNRRDLWRERVAGPKGLHQQQIRFAFSTEGIKDPAELFKGLRVAIKAGLPREAALAALTLDAATLLGQEKYLGSLAAGKLAHITVLNGPFDDERSKVRYVFLDGFKFEYNKGAAPVAPATTPGAQPAAVVPSVAGVWQLEIEGADGRLPASLELSQAGNAISGLFRSEQGEGRIKLGTLNGNALELVVAIGAGAQTLELKLSAKLEQGKLDTLAGTLKSAFGGATKWSAFRRPAGDLKPVSGKNPVALKIDDDDDGAKNDAGKTDPTPKDAGKAPAGAADGSPAVAQPGDLPVELEADRRRRPLPTGGNLLIRNGTVLAGRGEPLPETSVLIRQGKIAAIGRDLQPEPGMAVIEATGRFVAPGIIDSHSHIMFSGGMGGVNEATQSIVSEVRVRDALRTDDVQEYRALAGGVTAARLLHGSANVVGGQDAVVKLKYGELMSRQLLDGNPQGVKFALGENVKFQSQRFPNTRLGVEATLNRAFMEAIDYRRQWMEHRRASMLPGRPAGLAPRRDLRLEALADIVDHQKFVHCHCYRADEILMLLRVATGLGIRVWSLQHVLEGYKVAPEIVAHGASCSTFSDWWAYKLEAYDATPYNAALLQSAGANVVIKSDDAELIRHLYAEAAKTMRYGGLAADAALRTITLNPAREVGLETRMGSIEVGKDADLAVFSGHPLNAFSRCEATVIDGEVYFMREKQPSAMSAPAAAASARPRPLTFPAREARDLQLNLTPTPARVYAITGATLHPLDGPDVERGTIVIMGDKIAALGPDAAIPTGAQVLSATGLHVYPGLIDAGTILGLIEIGKANETHDYQESGLFQPDLRAGVAVNPDSELIPVARAGGITTALLRPTGGIIAGQCSLLTLAGWTVPEMVLNFEAALQVNWPSGGDAAARTEQLREFLQQGRLYLKARQAAQADGPVADPRFDALAPYLKGEKRVFIEANSRQEIIEALLFAEKEQLKIVITGGADAWKVAGELKKRNGAVIVGPVMRSPAAEYDPFDAPYANPGRLHEAGVQFCIRSNSGSNSRNAPFEAAMAVAYGLPEEQALKAVTIDAARILQVDDRLGTLSAGKLANLVVTDGSPLQPSTQYKAVFIAGRPFAPESRQTRLYDKYQTRLREVQATQKK